MNIFGVMDVSGSALKAERVRAEVVASNMANAETTRTPEGGPSLVVTKPTTSCQAIFAIGPAQAALNVSLVDSAEAGGDGAGNVAAIARKRSANCRTGCVTAWARKLP